MNPDQKHPEYIEFSDVWKRCRDAVAGQRAIQEGGELYLPKLDEQADDAYKTKLLSGDPMISDAIAIVDKMKSIESGSNNELPLV